MNVKNKMDIIFFNFTIINVYQYVVMVLKHLMNNVMMVINIHMMDVFNVNINVIIIV